MEKSVLSNSLKIMLALSRVLVAICTVMELILIPVQFSLYEEAKTLYWIMRWMVLSFVLNVGILVVQSLLVRKYKGKITKQCYVAVYCLVGICTVIACQHYYYTHTQLIFMLPILLSIPVMSKRLTVSSSIFCFMGTVLSYYLRYFDPNTARNFWEDLMISTAYSIVYPILAYKLVCYLINQNQQLIDAKIEAEKASSAKSEFLSNMSHEIRTPINSILGMNEMIERESSEKNILEYSENIKNSGSLLLSIINDILDITKIEYGKIELLEGEYNPGTLISDTILLVRDRIEKKNLEFIVETTENLPTTLYGDSFRIKQIIVNFLTNSAKYTREGTITYRVSAEVNGDSCNLKFTVKDTGIGIKKEDQSRLFGQFERFELENNRNIEGTGLGLRIAKQLSLLMGGDIEVHSEYGVGSEFVLKISQKIVNSAPIGYVDYKKRVGNSNIKKYRASFYAPKAKILVVDDIEMNLIVFKNFLKDTKVQVDVLDNGEDCVRKACLEKYDVIFIDHMMPGMDGLATFSLIRSKDESINKETPCVMLTANAIRGAVEFYRKEGFADYISKPVEGKVLESLLVELLPSDKVTYPDGETMGTELGTDSDGEKEDKKIDCSVSDVGARMKTLFQDFDVQQAMASSGDSLDMFNKLLGKFREQNFAEKMNRCFIDEDWKQYSICAHSLKSTARTIGLVDLGEEGYSLEMAAKDENVEFLRKNHHSIMNDYKDSLYKIDVFLGNVEN